MRKPSHAILWELWMSSRIELLFRIGWQFAAALLLWSCTFFIANMNVVVTQVVCGIFVMLSTCLSVASLMWLGELDSHQHGFSFRLGFARPVSTVKLVAVPMLFIIATTIVCFLLPSLLMGSLLHVSMPLAGPSAVIACAVTCFTATAWSLRSIIGKVVAVLSLAIAMMVSLLVFHAQRDHPGPILLAIGKHEYYAFAWYHYAAILAVTMGAFVVTVFAVDRQRHGDDGWLEGFHLSWRGFSVSLPRRKQPFASPFAAQCWHEMRQFGLTLLVISMLAPIVVFAFITFISSAKPQWEHAPWGWLIALGFCPLVYQLIGADGALGLKRKQGALQFSAYIATRAISNDQLVAIKVLVIAGCSLVGLLLMGFAAGVHAILAGEVQAWLHLGRTARQAVGGIPVYWWLVGASNATLLYISSSSILLALGLWLPLHRKIFVCVALTGFIHSLLAIWDFKHGGLHFLWLTYSWVLPPAIFIGCVVALRKACASGFLGKQLFGGVFCLWVVYVLSTIALYMKVESGFPVPPSAVAIGVASLLIPLATTAIAPLALASHRHG